MRTSEAARVEMERWAQGIAGALDEAMPEGVLFTLILAESGDGGWLTYISNANRTDMISALEEMVQRLRSGADRH